MVEFTDRLLPDTAGEPGVGAFFRPVFLASLRVLLPIVPVGILYLLELTTFWGGFAFFVVAELIRWIGTAAYSPSKMLRPLVEMAAIAIAPLFSLAILLTVTAPMLDINVQTELINGFVLYLGYVPYAIASLFIFPLFRSRA